MASTYRIRTATDTSSFTSWLDAIEEWRPFDGPGRLVRVRADQTEVVLARK